MSRQGWKIVTVVVAVCGLASAGARHDGPSEHATAAPASPEAVCSDARVGKTFGGDTSGCRRYLDACLSDLTEAQRAEWGRSVDACRLGDTGDTTLYRCYAEVPWC